MDRLIKTAWRAFWVGLGASAVLIGQSVLGPTGPQDVSTSRASTASPAAAFAAPAAPNDVSLYGRPFASTTKRVRNPS